MLSSIDCLKKAAVSAVGVLQKQGQRYTPEIQPCQRPEPSVHEIDALFREQERGGGLLTESAVNLSFDSAVATLGSKQCGLEVAAEGLAEKAPSTSIKSAKDKLRIAWLTFLKRGSKEEDTSTTDNDDGGIPVHALQQTPADACNSDKSLKRVAGLASPVQQSRKAKQVLDWAACLPAVRNNERSMKEKHHPPLPLTLCPPSPRTLKIDTDSQNMSHVLRQRLLELHGGTLPQDPSLLQVEACLDIEDELFLRFSP